MPDGIDQSRLEHAYVALAEYHNLGVVEDMPRYEPVTFAEYSVSLSGHQLPGRGRMKTAIPRVDSAFGRLNNEKSRTCNTHIQRIAGVAQPVQVSGHCVDIMSGTLRI